MKTVVGKIYIAAMFLFTYSPLVADKLADKEDSPWMTPEAIFSYPPDRSIKSWVRLDILGTVNHPFPTIWVSSEEFKRTYPNFLITLQTDEYKYFIKHIRESACETKLEANPADGTLRITEYIDKQEQPVCIMTENKACNYLLKITALSSINWTSNRLKPIQLLANEYGCGSINHVKPK